MNMENLQQKYVYVVVGLGRSGTSTVTRGLKALGVDLGKKFGSGNVSWGNVKGSWEDFDVSHRINRRVIAKLDLSINDIFSIQDLCQNNCELHELKKLALHILKERTSHTNHWGFKDPHTSKILPFWQEAFAALKLQDKYVIALRNPLAVAHSYKRVEQTDIEKGLINWMSYLISALEGTDRKKRVMVSYDLMLENPHKQLNRIKEHLSIPDLTDASEIETYATKFLDKKMQHYEYSLEDLKSHPATSAAPLCVEMYKFFVRIANDEITFDSNEFVTTWHELKKDFAKVLSIYSYLDVMTKRNKNMERALRTIHKSVPWKLTYPLRMIDDKLRVLRRKNKERRIINQN